MKYLVLSAFLAVVSSQPLLFNRENTDWAGTEPAGNVENDGEQQETAALPVSLTYVVCPSGQYQCQDGQTCCRTESGQWGCCPYPRAVCCSDGKHCCPQGATCDLSSGKCNTGDFQTDWVAKEPSRPLEVTVVQQSVLVVKEPTRNTEDRVEQTDLDSKLRNVPCGGGYYCPDFTRCCPSPTAVWSCCPTNYPVCCSDGLHCCPAGTTCDVGTGTCRRGYFQTDWAVKELASHVGDTERRQPEPTRLVEGAGRPTKEPARSVGNIPCGEGYSCPDGNTCCKSAGEWKCCPLSQAVCCADGKHCCPHGKSCDPASETCKQRDLWVEWVKKSPAQLETESHELVEKSRAQLKIVPCPGGRYECQDGQVCCPQPSGGYGCCTTNYPVCCPDGEHCCQSGTTCDPTSRYCQAGDQMFESLPKIPARRVDNVICPDGKSKCPTGDTCCVLPSGKYGCCPFPNAVCCADGKHCCPHGKSCDPASGTCKLRDLWVEWLKKSPAQLETESHELVEKSRAQLKIVPCPGGRYQCQDGQVCCPQPSGGYGCCTTNYPVCCPDGEHCCQSGTTCDPTSRYCQAGDQMFESLPKIPARRVDSVICPDGKSECPTGDTCCVLPSGKYGCCPFPNAVCCSDHEHCCRSGEKCDLSAKTCDKEMLIDFLLKSPVIPVTKRYAQVGIQKP